MKEKKINCGYNSKLAQDHFHVQPPLIGTVPRTKTLHMQFCVLMFLCNVYMDAELLVTIVCAVLYSYMYTSN